MQAALDAVGRAGMTSVDMRYFAARDGEPADYCRARVHECEIYVAVVGLRYGSVVPGEGISYTELEFQAATAEGLPRLVFLLEEASLGEGQADADLGPVEKFRQRLRDAGLVVRTFTSAAALELEVFHALIELTAAGGGTVRIAENAVGVHAVDLGAGPSGEYREEIVAYLRRLIDWVNTDPWPRDRRFGGPVLTLAAIERKLRVFAPGRAAEEDLDADDLARHCRRLVVLGGPGSGKTWLAKRATRRCAEDALGALAGGAGLDEVELPFYTTCSRLFGAGGDIRQAAVSSALDQLGDLGGPQLSAGLRAVFAERNAPAVLVIDSLDEAHGSQQRLRQADTLPWRIVLTTRPSSWNQQLAIDDTDSSHCVGELQPLRYPEDVEPFIRGWFAGEPARGGDLAAQIARRPDLQQAATVPLVLAFYCIVGGREPLPESRHDLYRRVLTRLLTGRWRGDEDRQPDIGACLQTLRAWAWPRAGECHPISCVGTWTEDILTERAWQDETDQEALDHVAMPLGPADIDTGKTLRRFIHRSIREHLVAELAAGLPVGEAAEVLLPHLWYDPDWEYSAPAAIAMHPQHDQLLRDLLGRAATPGQIPGVLPAVDAGWEFRRLLARVASESSEADWSPEIMGLIRRARLELAVSGHLDALGGAARWASSNRETRGVLLGLLADPANGWAFARLVDGVVQFALSPEDKGQARDALIGLLRGYVDGLEHPRIAGMVVGGIVQLATTAKDKRQARDALIRLLSSQADGWVADELATGVSMLSPTAHDKRHARDLLLGLARSQADSCEAAWLVGRAVRVATTDEDKRDTRAMLLELLPGQADGWIADAIVACLKQLGAAAEDQRQARGTPAGLLPEQPKVSKANEPASRVSWRAPAGQYISHGSGTLLRLLTGEADGRAAAGLAAGMTYVSPTAEEKRQAREVLLGLLASETDSKTAAELAGTLARLSPAMEDKRQTRQALLRLLAIESHAGKAGWLVDGVIQADPSAGERGQARSAMLRLLAKCDHAHDAARLARRMTRLGPTAEEERLAREALLRLLTGPIECPLAVQLADCVRRLGPTAEDKRRTRDMLIGLLPGQADSQVAQELAVWVSRFDPAAKDRQRTRDALLGLLADHADAPLAPGLLGCLMQLTVTAQDRRRTRDALLSLLASHADAPLAPGLLGCLMQLTVTAQDRRRTRDALLKLLSTAQIWDGGIAGLIETVVQLATTAESKRQARQTLLALLAGQADGWGASELVTGIVQLSPTAQDKRRARKALLTILASPAKGLLAARLVDDLARLDATARDIRAWRAWQALPTAELLAAVRRNSNVATWLAALPHLAPLSAHLFQVPSRGTPHLKGRESSD